jgi:hypothetical protein
VLRRVRYPITANRNTAALVEMIDSELDSGADIVRFKDPPAAHGPRFHRADAGKLP